MRKVKVLHLIKSLNRGGAETLLAEGLRFADRDHFELSHAFFNPDLTALVQTLTDSGSTVTCFGGHNHVSMLRRVGRIARHLRKHQIDLLHCHLPTAAIVGRLAARMAGVPVVYTEHNKPEWYRRPTFLLNSWTYRLQDEVVAVSASVAESVRIHIRARVPVVVVRNGIDASHFRPAIREGELVRKMLGIAPTTSVVGTVAALVSQKCLDDWVTAARMIVDRHPTIRFLLVGDGPNRGALQDLIIANGLQGIVHLCGMHVDVRPYLAAMNIYMMSSAYEGLPVALLEAMAMQCVPVCTSVGGIPEVIRDGRNGFLTAAGEPAQLADKVVGLLNEPLRLRSIGITARRVVEEEFRIDRMTRELEAVYRRVLERRGRRSQFGRARDVARVS